MKGRPSGSAADGAESPVESDPDPPARLSLSLPASGSSSARSRAPAGAIANPKPGSGHVGNGYASRPGSVVTKAMSLPPQIPPSSASPSSGDLTMPRSSDSPVHPPRSRSLWSISLFSLGSAILGIGLLLTILNALITRQLDPKGCRMSYMRPSYMRLSDFDTEHTRFATKYSLYLYREQGVDDESRVCIPVP